MPLLPLQDFVCLVYLAYMPLRRSCLHIVFRTMIFNPTVLPCIVLTIGMVSERPFANPFAEW